MPSVSGGIPVVRNDLAWYGRVLTVPTATTFTADIQGLGDSALVDYHVYVLRDSAGAGALPQGEKRRVTVYTSSTGAFTIDSAFTAALAAGDEILVIHPALIGATSTAGQPLWYYGTVTAVPGANQFTIPELAGLGAGIFADVTGPYEAFVVRDAGGVSAAPQGEMRTVTAYATATGIFTTEAFSAAVAVGDFIMILSPVLKSGLTTDRVRTTYYVDGTNGNDAFDGLTPETAFATIGAATAVAVAGDRIQIAEDTYDEAVAIAAAQDGLEIICEPGVILTNTTPGTVVTVAGDDVYWYGGTINQAGQTGISITGNRFLGSHIVAQGCADGFEINGLYCRLEDCRSVLHTTSGFEINAGYNDIIRCSAYGTPASNGFYLANAAADECLLYQCNTLNCSGAGYEIVVGADNNVVSHCNQSELCGGPADAGANNTWTHHGEESQIAIGNTLAQDLADIHTEVAAIGDHGVYSMDFWSVPGPAGSVIDVDNAATDIALPDVVVAGIPAGATIIRAIAIFMFRVLEETSGGANALDGAQEIQVRDDSPSAWTDAINFIADQFTLAANARESGMACIGAIDVSGTVDGNDTYNFQWDEALADADDISFYDIQVGLRIWFTV